MKVKINKEDYYKIKCEEWFNERNFIVYGMFATYKEYMPITFEGIYTKTRTRIMYIDSWQELYERKREALHCILTSPYTKKQKDIEKIPYHYSLGFVDCGGLSDVARDEIDKTTNYFKDKINELIEEVNKLKNRGE